MNQSVVDMDPSSEWPSEDLRDRLESISWDFRRRVVPGLKTTQPTVVWHSTTPAGIKGILESGRLWMTSTRDMVDRQEISWGNALLISAALHVHDELGHSAGLNALLHDHTASLFLNEREAFVACFAEIDDSPNHWEERYVDGAALVFDSHELSSFSRLSRSLGPGQPTGLLQVQYDDGVIRRVAIEYFKRVVACARSVPDGEHRALAQWLVEPGFLSLFVKRRSWAWEKEWRIIVRSFVDPSLIKDPPRRVELDIRKDCSLREVILGPRATPGIEAEVRALVADRWPATVLVRRSSVCV